jgi:hypothetical protein
MFKISIFWLFMGRNALTYFALNHFPLTVFWWVNKILMYGSLIKENCVNIFRNISIFLSNMYVVRYTLCPFSACDYQLVLSLDVSRSTPCSKCRVIRFLCSCSLMASFEMSTDVLNRPSGAVRISRAGIFIPYYNVSRKVWFQKKIKCGTHRIISYSLRYI